MGDVGDQPSRRMLDAILPYPGAQIRPLVGENLGRYSRALLGFFQLLVDDLAIGLPYRIQGQRLHLFMAQTPLVGRQIPQPHAEDEQAFFRADLNTVIGDPHPIVAAGQRPRQLVVAQPQPPPPTRSPRGRGPGQVEKSKQQRQPPFGPPEGHESLAHQQKKQGDDPQRILMPHRGRTGRRYRDGQGVFFSARSAVSLCRCANWVRN